MMFAHSTQQFEPSFSTLWKKSVQHVAMLRATRHRDGWEWVHCEERFKLRTWMDIFTTKEVKLYLVYLMRNGVWLSHLLWT